VSLFWLLLLALFFLAFSVFLTLVSLAAGVTRLLFFFFLLASEEEVDAFELADLPF